MTSSIARWTTTVAAAACLATSSVAWSQTPPTSQPSTPHQQQQPTKQQQPSGKPAQQSDEAHEHLRQAQAALNDVPATVPAKAKSRIAELKRHLNNLEKSSAQGTKTTATTARGKSNWSTEVAAVDKILTELLGQSSTSGATEPTGTTGAPGAAGSKSSSTATMTLDETTKSKLMEVRTHVTAFAAAMSGTSGAASSSPSAGPPSTDPAAAAAQPPTSPSTNPPAATQPPTGQAPAAQNPTGAEQAQQPTAPAGQQADPEASKQHLTAARESLSQLTQLPAAAQLTGESRTHVSQLITNFNELITTKENWRASYDKVEANLTALLGPEGAEQPAAQNAPATPGAVGTSGTVAASVDPAIRAKLVEFRTHLKQFEQAAGGGGNEPAASPSASSTMNQSSSAANQPAAGQSPSPTTGQPASTTDQSTAGTTGSTTPSADQPASAMGQDNAVQHIEAIEAILNGRSSASSSTTGNAPAATTGAATTGNITLNQSQVEEIRMHLAELRKAVKK